MDILWRERDTALTSSHNSSGGLYLRVSMSSHSGRMNLWSLLVNDCIDIMDAIDWTRSCPDNIADFSSVYGIDAGLKHFLNVCLLKSTFLFLSWLCQEDRFSCRST